jgi:hypothetical protein
MHVPQVSKLFSPLRYRVCVLARCSFFSNLKNGCSGVHFAPGWDKTSAVAVVN